MCGVECEYLFMRFVNMNEKKTNNIKKRKEKYQGAVVEERLTVRRLVPVPMTGTNLWHVSASHMNRHLCAL
jgi:hypothetical protein